MPTIIPVASPGPSQLSTSTSNSSARDRAIAALAGDAVPQVNQNNISPEELSAVKPDQTEETSGQADTSEVTPEPSPKEDPLSSQYAVLARKEKAARQRAMKLDQEYKVREAALAAREAQLTEKATQDLSGYIPKDKLLRNPYGVLNELGVSYDKLTEDALRAQSPEFQAMQQMRDEMREELQQLREEQGNTKKSIQEQQTQAYQQALGQIRNEVKELVYTDPSYEAIKAARATNDVVELIERTFNEDGTLLTVEQAANAVEDYLLEEATKMAQINKVKERLARNSETKQPSTDPKQQATGEKNIKTLTNSVGSTRPLSARERALLAFKGELK